MHQKQLKQQQLTQNPMMMMMIGKMACLSTALFHPRLLDTWLAFCCLRLHRTNSSLRCYQATSGLHSELGSLPPEMVFWCIYCKDKSKSFLSLLLLLLFSLLPFPFCFIHSLYRFVCIESNRNIVIDVIGGRKIVKSFPPRNPLQQNVLYWWCEWL